MVRRRRFPHLALWTVAALGVGCASYGVSGTVWPAVDASAAPAAVAPTSTGHTTSSASDADVSKRLESSSAAPDGDSVYLVGDSLMFTALWVGAGEGAPADMDWAAWLGWTADDAQPRLDEAVQQGQADTVVVALGMNDSSLAADDADGWSPADVARFQQIFDTVPQSSCLVVVLPGYTDGIDEAHAAEVDDARTDLQALAAARDQGAATGSTVVVDWQEVIDAQPSLIHDDGVHLARDPVTDETTAEAAAALTTLYWQGVDTCTR